MSIAPFCRRLYLVPSNVAQRLVGKSDATMIR